MTKQKLGTMGLLFILIAVAITVTLWSKLRTKAPTPEQHKVQSSRDAALICTTDLATQYHIHPELKIVINGVESPVPVNIGIKPGCMNAIHTHGSDGVIHIESPVKKDFTLGDFFAVWHQDFSEGKILDAVVTDETEIVVTVDGDIITTYENTILKDKDKIVISYQEKN